MGLPTEERRTIKKEITLVDVSTHIKKQTDQIGKAINIISVLQKQLDMVTVNNFGKSGTFKHK